MDLFIGFVALFFYFIFILIIIIYFKFYLFFSPFSSELCGWQGLSALAWASEVGEVNSGHWTIIDLPAPHNFNWQELAQRSPSQHKDPGPPNGPQTLVLHAPCQTTSKTGTQPHPLAERLTKIILSSQTPKNTPLDVALLTRKIQTHPPEHRHQSPPPGKLHKPLSQSHQLGADTKNNRKYEPAAWEKETTNTVS